MLAIMCYEDRLLTCPNQAFWRDTLVYLLSLCLGTTESTAAMITITVRQRVSTAKSHAQQRTKRSRAALAAV